MFLSPGYVMHCIVIYSVNKKIVRKKEKKEKKMAQQKLSTDFTYTVLQTLV